MRRRDLFALAAGLGAAGLARAARVEQVSGTGRVLRRGASLPLTPGEQLQPGDQLEMDARGEALLVFPSGVRLIVRAGSQIALDEPPTPDESLALRLLRGALRYANQAAKSLAHRRARIETPTGYFGVRGTDFDLVHLDAALGPLLPAGTYVFVRDGEVEAVQAGRVAQVGPRQTGLPPGLAAAVVASSQPMGGGGASAGLPPSGPTPGGDRRPGVANVPQGPRPGGGVTGRDPFAWMEQAQTYEQRLVRRSAFDHVLDRLE